MIEIPEDHPWYSGHRNDRALQRCPDWGLTVPINAGDIQAGIVLYRPDCLSEMEWGPRDEEPDSPIRAKEEASDADR